jgi:hypothetical protein
MAHGLLVIAGGEKKRANRMGDSLKSFLAGFLNDRVVTTEGELSLDVSPEELEELGLFFVEGMCGWALGLQLARSRRRLIEVTDQTEREKDAEEFGFDGRDDEESYKDDEELIN